MFHSYRVPLLLAGMMLGFAGAANAKEPQDTVYLSDLRGYVAETDLDGDNRVSPAEHSNPLLVELKRRGAFDNLPDSTGGYWAFPLRAQVLEFYGRAIHGMFKKTDANGDGYIDRHDDRNGDNRITSSDRHRK